MDEGQGDNAGNVKSESQPINIVVKDQTGHEVHFRIKTSTKFEKVFSAYCQKQSLNPEQVKFMFDGARLAKDHTPAVHDMQDNDTIDCMIEQVGGALQL